MSEECEVLVNEKIIIISQLMDENEELRNADKSFREFNSFASDHGLDQEEIFKKLEEIVQLMTLNSYKNKDSSDSGINSKRSSRHASKEVSRKNSEQNSRLNEQMQEEEESSNYSTSTPNARAESKFSVQSSTGGS